MDVDTFVAQYRPVWQRLEALVATGPRGLTKLGGRELAWLVRDYQQVSGHLAEAQGRFHDPALEAYLTRIVSRAHGAIYGVRPRSVRDILGLFGQRYRAAFHRTLPHTLLAGAILLGVSLLVGIWAATSPEAQAGLVPGAIGAASEGLGDDLREPSTALSGFIFFNNVRVALLAFALGITLGLGTAYVLVMNAVLIGGLAGTTLALGSGARFFALVLPHGFLELTAIAIAAGAGLRIGWAIVEPGDRTRRAALMVAAEDAVIVALGVVPAFLVAALIEGLLTGVTGMPVVEVGLGALVAVAYVAWLAGVGPRPRPTGPPGP